jgi:hypothetical protein
VDLPNLKAPPSIWRFDDTLGEHFPGIFILQVCTLSICKFLYFAYKCSFRRKLLLLNRENITLQISRFVLKVLDYAHDGLLELSSQVKSIYYTSNAKQVACM